MKKKYQNCPCLPSQSVRKFVYPSLSLTKLQELGSTDTEMGCNEKYLWTCLAKDSIIGCYSYIADHVQHMSPPNGISSDLVIRGESKSVDNLTTSGKSSNWEKGQLRRCLPLQLLALEVGESGPVKQEIIVAISSTNESVLSFIINDKVTAGHRHIGPVLEKTLYNLYFFYTFTCKSKTLSRPKLS